MTNLGTLSGGTSSQANAINDSGMIVGEGYASNGVAHAFVDVGGVMEDLNDLTPGSRWLLVDATGINKSGQICGYGVNLQGQTDAFILNPIQTPEPGTLVLCSIAAICLVSYELRRRKRILSDLDGDVKLHAFVLLAAALCSTPAAAQTFKTLDYPVGIDTELTGIDGKNIIGNANALPGGFLYNGSTFKEIADPLVKVSPDNFWAGTWLTGISGNSIVGDYLLDGHSPHHGFIYNGSAYTTIDDPLAGKAFQQGTFPRGISGGYTVGMYIDSSSVAHSFLYDGSVFTTLDIPVPMGQGVTGINVTGISGDNVIGGYQASASEYDSFVYDLVTNSFTTINAPYAVGKTAATGIDGNTVFGDYWDSSNLNQLFLYDISTGTYTALSNDLPGPIWMIGGISGKTIVGTYNDLVNDYGHGFVATIPEPSTNALLAAGAVGLAVLRVRRRGKLPAAN